MSEFAFAGGRQFAELPETHDPATLRNHIGQLPGVELGPFIDTVTESWIDFSLEGHEFTVNNQFGEYWFFVADPNAPAELLERVAKYAEVLLGDLTEGGAQLDRRGLAFAYGLFAAIIGVLLLRNAQVSGTILSAVGIALFAGTLWLARLLLGAHRKARGGSQTNNSRNVLSDP
jgi:hypothetical protein